MSGVRKRKIEADYLNTAAAGATSPIFSLCGTGFSKLAESPSAQTSKKRYVNMESSSQHVTGYEWSSAFESDQILDEAAVNYIVDIAKNMKSGPDADTDYVQVDLDKPVDGYVNTFKARKRTVAVAVKELPDNDGEMGVNGDFLGVTDPVTGIFNVTTKTFTADADATPAPVDPLAVASVAGSVSGKTALVVAPALASGDTYKYQTASSVTLPAMDATLNSDWTTWDGSAEITATTGNKIGVIEVDTDGKAKKGGIATVVSKV